MGISEEKLSELLSAPPSKMQTKAPVPPPSKGPVPKRRPAGTGLNRPGEDIVPSDVLSSLGWAVWFLSVAATANALRFVAFGIISFLVGLFTLPADMDMPIERVVIAEWVLAVIIAGIAAYVIQKRLTVLERPIFELALTSSGVVALVIDGIINTCGAVAAAPLFTTVMHWTLGWPLLFLLGALATIMPELFFAWSIAERRGGH